MPSYTTTITDADCCCSGGGCCTDNWPGTIYATFVSSCAEWNGQVVPLVWEGSGVWRGRYEGVTDECDIEISVNCSNGFSPTVVDFILGSGTAVFTGYYETPDCGPPIILEFGGVAPEEHSCCAGDTLDVTVTE